MSKLTKEIDEDCNYNIHKTISNKKIKQMYFKIKNTSIII